ncbi:MAG: alpha/beta hydrolase [Lachnospiraceae bacterium]|nr:alpha/beta hydrolase [Lachnospiraceae bacterium]
MYFTTMNTFREIMEWPDMKNWMRFLFLEETLDFFQKKYENEPLRAAAFLQKTSWGDDLRGVSDQLVDTANLVLDIQNGKRRCLHLRDWRDWKPKATDEPTNPDCSFIIVPVVKDKEVKKPAAVICPGGAYLCVSFQNEGTPIQIRMEDKGYRCFMLNYRIAQNAEYPNAQMDLLEAVAYVRDNADEYGIDTDKVVTVGFSAGGHLVASAAGLAEELLPKGKPNAVVAGYPVITLKKEDTHKESAENVTGFNDELREKLSVEEIVNETYPPAFAWACEDDDCVPCVNTTYYEKALEKYGIEHETHLYPTGGHGCGLAFGNSAQGWSGEMFDFLKRVL